MPCVSSSESDSLLILSRDCQASGEGIIFDGWLVILSESKGDNMLTIEIASISHVTGNIVESIESVYETPVQVDNREVVGEYISKIGRAWKEETGYSSMVMVYKGSFEAPVYWFSRSPMPVLRTASAKEAKLFVSKFGMVMGATVFHAANEATNTVYSFTVSGKPTIKFVEAMMQKYGLTVFLDSGCWAPSYVRTPQGVVKVVVVDALSNTFVGRWRGALGN